MATEVKRIRLKSLTDIQGQMARLYREGRQGTIKTGEMTALSQHLKRLHDMKVQQADLDISEELLELEQRLTRLQEKR